MSRVPYVAVFLGLSCAFGAASTQQKADTPILSANTDLVALSVTVVDRHGRLVTGLPREAFTVYDAGQRQAIEFFTSDDVPATVGLVIDGSGSMRGRRDDVAAAGAAFAAFSHPRDQFFVVNFNETVWPGLPRSVAFTEDVNELGAALSIVPPRGMTALYDAVDRALAHLQLGTRGRKALIVISDGGDNASSRTLESVLEHARRTSSVIYAVTLADPDDHDARPHVLKRLARETGGEAFTPARTDRVTGSFERIAREIRSVYTIGFLPPDTSDGGFRAIRVVVDARDGRQLVARTRAGYYAGPSGRTLR
jgi:VWFA-related protein